MELDCLRRFCKGGKVSPASVSVLDDPSEVDEIVKGRKRRVMASQYGFTGKLPDPAHDFIHPLISGRKKDSTLEAVPVPIRYQNIIIR